MLWLVASAGVMVALAVPVLGLGDHVSIAGASTLPADSSVRQAYEQASLRYGPTAMSPVTVLTDGAPDALQTSLQGSPDVAAVEAVPLDDGRTALAVTTNHEPYTAANRDFVQDLRERSDGDYLVGTLGVSDLIIIRTDDATLVTTRKKEGEVKRLVEEIKAKGLGRFL